MNLQSSITKPTWLKDLDNDTLTVCCINSLINLRVLAAANFFDYLIVLLGSI